MSISRLGVRVVSTVALSAAIGVVATLGSGAAYADTKPSHAAATSVSQLQAGGRAGPFPNLPVCNAYRAAFILGGWKVTACAYIAGTEPLAGWYFGNYN